MLLTCGSSCEGGCTNEDVCCVRELSGTDIDSYGIISSFACIAWNQHLSVMNWSPIYAENQTRDLRKSIRTRLNLIISQFIEF